MLGECSDAMLAGDHSYFRHVLVENVDAIFAEFNANGTVVNGEPENKTVGYSRVWR